MSTQDTRRLLLEPLVHVREGAQLLGVSSRTLRRMIACGELTCVRVGRRVVLEPDELRRYIERRRSAP